jgi:hypothetical protein
MQGVRVVDGNTDLKAVLAVRADSNHHREYQRVTDAPIVVVATPAGKHAPLDDPVGEHIETDLDMATAVATRGRKVRRPAHRREVMPVQPLEVRRIDAVLHDL